MPSPPLAFRAVAVLAIFAFLAGCLAAAANAQAPAPTTQQRTLVAVGTGTIAVTPKDRNDNASIVAAVRDANDRALPAALTDARTQATQLAAAAGMTLGPVISLSNSGTSTAGVFYGPYYGVAGSFGPNRYCGTIKTRSSRIGRDGKRHYGRLKSHRVCRVPAVIQRSVQLTYALA
ncbi:SIMPL domain-containing protein [Conexibacter woesei]|uniref:SIMPL domain-containing protein n=1 Tax=Conexibacter woesei TaxID=191495 RepID=UPI00041015A4|nr:SIMPL domain-containing protein [Conexibacter woesei]